MLQEKMSLGNNHIRKLLSLTSDGCMVIRQFQRVLLKDQRLLTVALSDCGRSSGYHHRASLLGIRSSPFKRDWVDADLLGVCSVLKSGPHQHYLSGLTHQYPF